MPYKIEKIKIDDPFLDRRTKLIPCQKEMVLYWWAEGKTANYIARMFKVSVRMIEYLVKPGSQKRSKAKYDRVKAVKNVRGSRVYKDSKLREFLTGEPKKRKTKWDREKKRQYLSR